MSEKKFKFLNFDQFVNEKYQYVNEAGEGEGTPATPAAAPLSINLSNDFPSGKWKLTPQTSQSIEAQLPKIEDFIKANSNSPITITIKSGESQVPNRDAEAPAGPDGQHPVLQPGQLATNRATAVKSVLDQFVAGLKQKGINTANIKVEIAKPVIGQTPWKAGNNPSDPAYTQEQFINLDVAATPAATNVLSSFATKGEIIYDQDKKAFGTLHYKSAVNGASQVTANEPSVLRLCDGNTGQYLNQYVEIPAGKAQEYFGTTNTVQSPEIANQLKAQAKPVPQNDPLFGKTVNAAQ